MERQIESSILAVAAAQEEIAHLKEKFGDDDAWRNVVEDAEMDIHWTIKQLERLKEEAVLSR
jgi:hypothetical protein